MFAYVYPSVRMYLSTSCVRLSILVFACVHARVREGVCVIPSVRPCFRPFVCLSVYLSVRVHILASKCLIVHACVHAFSNEVSFLSEYSFANVLIYFTLSDSLCQVFMYSKWSF